MGFRASSSWHIMRMMNFLTALRLTESAAVPCIALTGSGGKSTALFRLGSELTSSGRQTLLTTTTKVWARQADHAPFTITTDDETLLARELPVLLPRYGRVLALSGSAAEPEKMQGLPVDTVCRLARLASVQAVVVEADGSRERPLKAPADHEPVIPPCATDVIHVVGLSALGKPLHSDWVHRPERCKPDRTACRRPHHHRSRRPVSRPSGRWSQGPSVRRTVMALPQPHGQGDGRRQAGSPADRPRSAASPG